ncbi:MAG: hypothetical protein V4508_24380 [Pseudomonadota bacterium]
MKPRHMALGAALLVAAGFALFGDKSPSSSVAEAVVRTPTASAHVSAAPVRARAPAAVLAEPQILRLLPRGALVGEQGEALGAADAPFGSRDWTPPPPKPGPAPPPPPPTAPPLPFTYMGKAVGDGVWEIYLARGDKTYLVHEKMVIDGVYRVDAIKPPTLTLTFLPLNQVQQLNIGVFD